MANAKLLDGEGYRLPTASPRLDLGSIEYAYPASAGLGWDSASKSQEESSLRQEAAIAEFLGLSTVSLSSNDPSLQQLCEALREQVENEFRTNVKKKLDLDDARRIAGKTKDHERMVRDADRKSEVAKLDRQGVPDQRYFASALSNIPGVQSGRIASSQILPTQAEPHRPGLPIDATPATENGNWVNTTTELQELSRQWAMNGGSSRGLDAVFTCLSQGKQLFFSNRQLQAAYNSALKAVNT